MPTKSNLREYQEALSRKLQRARGGIANTKLAIMIGEEHWLINLADAAEVLPVPALTRVPATRSWFRGLAKVRGNLYGVVDFSGFLGGPQTPLLSASRLVLANEKFGVNTSLLVGQTLGLRNEEQLFSNEANGARPPWVFREWRSGVDDRWRELNFGELVKHPEFLRVGLNS
jgi:twitching motility protein PilI